MPALVRRKPSRSPAGWRRRSVATGTMAVTVLGLGFVVTDSAAQAAPRPRAAADGARITKTARVASRALDITIQSPALGKSVNTRILLPAGWTQNSTRTWPVLYAYHGGQDGFTSWTKNSDIESWAAAYNVIVVMPEAANGSYADWYNYGKGGSPKWETFHTKEVVQLIERNYHGGGARAAIGNSSGGQGAVSYAARHPGMFRYVASLSGILSMRSPGMPAMLMFTNAGNGQDPFAIWGIPWADDANWAAHDPASLAPKLKGTGVFFSAGTTGRPGPGDPDVAPWDIGLLSEIAVGANNNEFRKKLDAAGVPYTAHIYGDGRHNWPAWVRESKFIWPTLMKSIGATKVS